MDLINAEKLEELQSLSNGTNELVLNLLDKYITNSQKFMVQAREEISNGDTGNLEYIFHTLKGSSLSLGLTKLGEVMTMLNQRAKDKDFENLIPELDNIEKLIDEVKVYKESVQ